jgi:hypothetical protein
MVVGVESRFWVYKGSSPHRTTKTDGDSTYVYIRSRIRAQAQAMICGVPG